MTSFIKILFVGLIGGFGLKYWVVESYTVPTDSMTPTIAVGERVWVLKLPFTPKAGDIVAFEKDGEHFVKRVIGLPTDSVLIRGRFFNLNKKNNDQNAAITEGGVIAIIPKAGTTLPLNSRNFDFYAPLIERYEGQKASRLFDKIFINAREATDFSFTQNYYFVQGDNTNTSTDSRHFGLISEKTLVGILLNH